MPGKSQIFDPITRWYDRLNTFFSLGIDKFWRKKCVEVFDSGRVFIDVASGTGKTAALLRAKLKGAVIAGLDPSFQMVTFGKERGRYKGVYAVLGIGEELPFRSSTVDGITCTFGLRNFTDLRRALQEIHRVLRPGGIFSAVEVTVPRSRLVKVFFMPYFTRVMPAIGNALSGTKAYTYLRNSVLVFPSRESFIAILEETGFRKSWYTELSGGIACHYIAVK